MIEVLAYLSLAFMGLRFLVILVNVCFHYYPRKEFSEKPLLSILIPARNEEQHLQGIIEAILAQRYPRYELWICDDQSTDHSPAILSDYTAKYAQIQTFRARDLQEGWTGKNSACHQLAERASGELLLFLDADMHISGDILGRMAGLMEKRRLDLLSIFPHQRMQSRGEQLTVPVMNWILLSLLPLPLVLHSRLSSFSAANGQFMLFRADTYKKLQPHSALKSSPVEDIGIMKFYKKNRRRCLTLLGDHRVSCRMYSHYEEAIRGFSKNILHFFSNSRLWLAIFILFSAFGPVFIAIWSLPAAGAALLAALLGRILISRISAQPAWRNVVLIPHQYLAFLRMIAGAIQQKRKGSLHWKNREIKLS